MFKSPMFKSLMSCLLMSLFLMSHNAKAETWEFEISPYLWLVNQQGQTGYIDENGIPIIVDMDMSFSDIFENLDSAALLNVQANKGDWQFWIDLVYMKLKYDTKTEFASAELSAKQKMLDIVAAYRFSKQANMEWYAFAGGRVIDISNKLEVRFFERRRDPSFADEWYDPLIGIKNKWSFSEGFYLISRADLGGFGIGSDLSWALNLTMNQDLSEHWALKYSFRYIDIDYDDNDFIFDVASSGFGLGVTYQF
ncbi:outer membrane beta-barrel protein [Shewanella sp. KX20019]|uniref:outer membrane beta-barrel protein n=1 Tax=Shewanella sp. KX20019 TaxID=2803864 RepID=UPI001927D19F|nr:outer membrane beta-barrel protein [Shewanella sp. KX20019]QQX79086.1 outer membrane beta-barrel protein [Shewanella sp. KX20019]